MAGRLLRNLDLAVLAVGLAVFAAAGLPLIGWAAATAGWLASRAVQTLLERRAAARADRRAAMSARGIALVARVYLVGTSVLVAGLIEREAGFAAGVLAVATFTVYLLTLFVVNALAEGGR